MSETGTVDATCSTCNERGKGTYTMEGSCLNCGLEFTATLSKSHSTRDVECPRCGCSRTYWKRA